MALYPLFRSFVFALDAERAHRLTLAALKTMPGRDPPGTDAMLAVDLAGLSFPNPIGLAAGFDKNAQVYRQMLGLGFGSAEVGTLTPLPQVGNPKPRLFRLPEDRAVINRMGFNNGGLEAAKARLSGRVRGNGIVGVNIGANKDSVDRIADYARGVREMAPLADYLAVNISSPNTPGLRALQDRAALEDLLTAVVEARAAAGNAPPIFLKLAPDLERADIDDIAAVSVGRMDALIVSNTTISRPSLRSSHRGEAGGLSGAPLKALALARLRDFRAATGGAIPLIAAGGIETGADALARIRAGASLIQLYSALVYEGPGLVKRIAAELKALLRQDGFANVMDAVAAD
ncbi:quinone-dependent dihydroorotate dehydrogenase [Allosphingosinicella deserti]|uniref:Dihydroorotate dehydrogenase (quinone) n=1 Tax=Allosphingosinicella deserti TaxID=2116704 RepID=A0A2P7QWB1_9SPHN|nr:quinone-dependent dihydroorotate dehydrogenase [Sphingomonas deserti]PSJ42250.1 dihydroorotate dehydrogenase (quinone) [Sphingomonas deserti]